MQLSIIIVNWNVKDFLRKCLSSVFRCAGNLEFEVFVVDNNSCDGSPQMVEKEFPQARLIANQENLGFSKANNQAIKQSRGEYILILNPDTEITEGAFGKMLNFMESRKDAGMLAPRLIFPDGRIQASLVPPFSFFSFFMNEYFPFSPYAFRMHEAASLKRVFNPTGACLLVRREVFERIGLFDESFFVSYEDVDFCRRIQQAGIPVFFSPEARIIHHKSQCSKKDYWQCLMYREQGLARFVRKHYGQSGIIVLLANVLIQLAIRDIIFPACHVLFGRPRDPVFFKKEIRIRLGCVLESFKGFN